MRTFFTHSRPACGRLAVHGAAVRPVLAPLRSGRSPAAPALLLGALTLRHLMTSFGRSGNVALV